MLAFVPERSYDWLARREAIHVKMTELLLIRHAQAQAGPSRHWLGWSDPPLTSTGRAQAQAIAHRLHLEKRRIGAVYTSPLRRALETAQAIGKTLHRPPVAMAELKEIHFGKLEGVTLQEMERRFPVLHTRWQDKTDMEFQWPGGERRADFFSRVADACQGIVARHPHENVVVVAHGGTIRACLAHLVPDQLKTWWTYSLDNTGLTHVSARGSVTHLLALNDVSHLLDVA